MYHLNYFEIEGPNQKMVNTKVLGFQGGHPMGTLNLGPGPYFGTYGPNDPFFKWDPIFFISDSGRAENFTSETYFLKIFLGLIKALKGLSTL